MLLGFAAAFTGDWFWVIRRCGMKDAGRGIRYAIRFAVAGSGNAIPIVGVGKLRPGKVPLNATFEP